MNFYFGASTSSHQVEGGNENDWSKWELQSAPRLAALARDKQNWPEYLLEQYPNPLQEENYISGRAADHYNRYEEDFDIAKELGHNAHRFSIEWSRIEPREGEFSEDELEHYRQVVKALRDRNIEPFVTLWHWTLPQWLADKGGVLNKRFPKYFARYTEKVVEALGGRVKFWITINEPLIVTSHSYIKGVWPPQKKNPLSYIRAISQLVKAHKQAYKKIRGVSPDAQIGIAKYNKYFKGILRPVGKWFWNDRFLQKIKNHQDFIGVNFYRGACNTNKQNDMSWPLCPADIYYVLKEASCYNVPLYIAENGLADARDEYRAWFIQETLAAIKKFNNEVRPVKDGGPPYGVNGYLYWSLLDNFEWDKGFWPRFGLVEIDYKTMERTVRPSAWEYKKIIESWQKTQDSKK